MNELSWILAVAGATTLGVAAGLAAQNTTVGWLVAAGVILCLTAQTLRLTR